MYTSNEQQRVSNSSSSRRHQQRGIRVNESEKSHFTHGIEVCIVFRYFRYKLPLNRIAANAADEKGAFWFRNYKIKLANETTHSLLPWSIYRHNRFAVDFHSNQNSCVCSGVAWPHGNRTHLLFLSLCVYTIFNRT